jgi:hypothetical protein
MTDKNYRLIDAINRCGIDNSQWGVVMDVQDTKAEFGTIGAHRLPGKWLYAYTDNDGVNPISEWSPQVTPDLEFGLEEPFEPNAKVVLYKLD